MPQQYWRAPETLHTNRDETKIVAASDPDVDHVLIGKDGLLPLEKAHALKLVGKTDEPIEAHAKMVTMGSAENKALEKHLADNKKSK